MAKSDTFRRFTAYRGSIMKLLSLLTLLTLSACQNPSRVQSARLTDFVMTLNLHAPTMLLARADEVIE
jgi:hypothetical protein